jgi:hypothetical protein
MFLKKVLGQFLYNIALLAGGKLHTIRTVFIIIIIICGVGLSP